MTYKVRRRRRRRQQRISVSVFARFGNSATARPVDTLAEISKKNNKKTRSFGVLYPEVAHC